MDTLRSYANYTFHVSKNIAWFVSTTSLVTLLPLIFLVERELSDQETTLKVQLDRQMLIMDNITDTSTTNSQ